MLPLGGVQPNIILWEIWAVSSHHRLVRNPPDRTQLICLGTHFPEEIIYLSYFYVLWYVY